MATPTPLSDLAAFFKDAGLICEPTEKRIGRPRLEADRIQTPADSMRRKRAPRNKSRREDIAVLDMETDPFDKVGKAKIFPFVAELYSDQFDPVVIWEECFDVFVEKIVAAIEALPREFTIYAHNGGRFDYMFLIHKMRGKISFKGRGIMDCKIGNHNLRDSFHLIPEKLAAYQKEHFDYKNMARDKRLSKKQQILSYLHSDCVYLFDLVKKFIGDFGLKMSIGQAAMCELKKHYEVAKFSDGWDNYIRDFFFGGRVECLKGRGHFKGAYRLYDVNSMYPDVMANCRHPIGSMEQYKIRPGMPNENTAFVDLECVNRGALIGRTSQGETTALIKQGRFKTTIHEYNVALKYGLISDVKVNFSLDCAVMTDFSKFVTPLYEKRLALKEFMGQLKKEGKELTQAFIEAKKDDMFYKFLLNNGYGKFAQNPRRFKEHYITGPNEQPDDAWFKSINKLPETERAQYCLPTFESEQYWIWSKPAPAFTFNNVGTAASITGASRAKLLEALVHAEDAIYCDTDSIICKSLSGVQIHKSELGAWDLEDEFSKVVILGKKLYSVDHPKPKQRTPEQLERGISPNYTIKSKGVSGATWEDMLTMLNGETIEMPAFAPTLTRYGEQIYMARRIRATAPQFGELI